MNKKKYWIGKIKENQDNKKLSARVTPYILSSISTDKRAAEGMASFMGGFAKYEIVEIEIKEKRKGECE